jgi:hypothetical protein
VAGWVAVNDSGPGFALERQMIIYYHHDLVDMLQQHEEIFL